MASKQNGNGLYVVTDDSQVIELITQRVSADNALRSTGDSYMRMLIATAQQELGIQGKRQRGITDDTIQEHIQTVAAVHKRFYAILATAEATLAIDTDDNRPRAQIAASRLGFSRSGYSTVRSWMERGRNSLYGVNPSGVTKRKLYEQTPRRDNQSAQETARNGVLRLTNKLLSQVMLDQEHALVMLQDVVNILSRGFDQLGIDARGLRHTVDTLVVAVQQPSRSRGTVRAIRAAA